MSLRRSYALVSILVFIFTTASVPLSNHQQGVFPWYESLLILLLVILVVGLLMLWNARQPLEYADAFAHSPEQTHGHEPEPEEVQDDLKIIEGIGPKISALFNEAGIRTFAQLAQTDPAHLESILRESGLRLGDPSTWPEQARLAARGEWDALERLQDELKGGRRE